MLKKQWMKKVAQVVASMALFLTTVNLDEVCLIWLYQPEVSEKVRRLRRKMR